MYLNPRPLEFKCVYAHASHVLTYFLYGHDRSLCFKRAMHTLFALIIATTVVTLFTIRKAVHIMHT